MLKLPTLFFFLCSSSLFIHPMLEQSLPIHYCLDAKNAIIQYGLFNIPKGTKSKKDLLRHIHSYARINKHMYTFIQQRETLYTLLSQASLVLYQTDLCIANQLHFYKHRLLNRDYPLLKAITGHSKQYLQNSCDHYLQAIKENNIPTVKSYLRKHIVIYQQGTADIILAIQTHNIDVLVLLLQSRYLNSQTLTKLAGYDSRGDAKGIINNML